MKTIEVDEELYRYIASQTRHIGESASDILRRLLGVDHTDQPVAIVSEDVKQPVVAELPSMSQSEGIIVSKDAGKMSMHESVKAMRELLISDSFAERKKVIDRFMLVLSTLYGLDAESFSEAMAVKGRKRIYFADNEHTLLEHGNTTKPKVIPDTPFWVITNTNTSRKQQMVEQVMTRMNFPADIIEKVSNAI